MKKTGLFIAAFLLLCFSTQGLQAAVRSWEIDKNHSNFYFSVNHIFSKIDGRFTDFSSTFLFDPNNLPASKIVFDIQVKSIITHNAKRDKHLLSQDFFDASRYPVINFTSTNIKKTGVNTFDIAGKFTIKGKSYDLVLPLKLIGIKDHPMVKGSEVMGFSGELTLDRLAYGVGSGKFVQYGVVGKLVRISLSLELLAPR